MKSKAWKILNNDEKSALTLAFNHKKSTWEAGEIMDKSHYKYLEISTRAKFFFQRFTTYFETTGDLLIPANTEIPLDFRDFIHYTIENRLTYTDAVKKLDRSSPLRTNDTRKKTIVLSEYLNILKDSNNENYIMLYDLILDFDRWNNFRILPDALQEPSAFKRRNKTRLMKHLKNLRNIDEFHIYRFTKKLSSNTKIGKKLYLPLISENFSKGYTIVTIDRNRELVEYISKEFQLYLFNENEIANEYSDLVEQYINLEKKNCKIGQQFWPVFRKLIQKSYNYNQVNNIIPRRKNLEKSFREIDFDLKSSKKPIKNKFFNL